MKPLEGLNAALAEKRVKVIAQGSTAMTDGKTVIVHGELAASVINTAAETALVNAQQQQVIEQIVAEMLAIYNRNHSNIMEWK